jgi:hypothetical protein
MLPTYLEKLDEWDCSFLNPLLKDQAVGNPVYLMT